jgi:hypothetical protein
MKGPSVEMHWGSLYSLPAAMMQFLD